MYYYRYNEATYVIEEKSETELNGDNVCSSLIDFDIDLNDIYIGAMDENNFITFYSERIKPVETYLSIVKELKNQNKELSSKMEQLETTNIESELETDLRLSMLELGLA